jgi:hypothetical protein
VTGALFPTMRERANGKRASVTNFLIHWMAGSKARP